jgi:folate-dependent phosphoribosylglycinamide formyltransferase PurN
VAVIADQNGDSYNQAPATYTLPGLPVSQQTGQNSISAKGGQMSGGTSKTITVVTQADVDTAVAAAVEKDKDNIGKALDGVTPADFLVLAGYMRVLTDAFIESYRSPRGYARIVNVHPSILPAFPGVGSYAQAFRHGSQLAGVTVHLVEPAVDDGPICAQASFPIGDCRSAEEVEARGLRLEHVLYPETLAWVLPEKFEVETRSLDINGKGLPPGRSIRRLCVRPN